MYKRSGVGLRHALLLCAALFAACGGDDGVVGTGAKPSSPPTGGGGGGGVGGGSGTSIAHVRGAAEKGPFVKGSEVLVGRLSADGVTTTATTLSEIADDLGTFTFQAAEAGPVLIVADGYHFDEISGALSRGRLVLRAVYNVTNEENQTAYVNVLTHLAYKRVQTLMGQGVDVVAALAQAEAEVLESLEPVLPVAALDDFSRLSVYDLDPDRALGNAYVLALSATLYQTATTTARSNDTSVDAELSGLLNQLASDIAADGAIDEPVRLDELRAATRVLRPDLIRAHLEQRSVEALDEVRPPADLDLFIDTDGDGTVNAQDEDDDNDGILDMQDISPYVYSTPPSPLWTPLTNVLYADREFGLGWELGEPAERLETQIARDREFSSIVASDVISGTTNVFTLPSGVYYARARAKNELGAWGPWSNVYEVPVDAFATLIRGIPLWEFQPDAALLMGDAGRVAIVGNTHGYDGSPVVFPASMTRELDGSGSYQAFENVAGHPEALVEWNSGGHAFVVRGTVLGTSDAGAELILVHNMNAIPWPDGPVKRINLIDTSRPGADVGPATLISDGDRIVVAMTQLWRETTPSGTTTQAAPMLVQFAADGSRMWEFDFAGTAANRGHVIGAWRDDNAAYVVVGAIGGGKQRFIATIASDGSALVSLKTFSIQTKYSEREKAAPGRNGGFLLLAGDTQDTLYGVNGAGVVLYQHAASELCACRYASVALHRDVDGVILAGAAVELDGTALTTSDHRPLVELIMDPATGTSVRRNVYQLDPARALLRELGPDYHYALTTLAREANGRVMILGAVEGPAGSRVGAIVIRSDASGALPSELTTAEYMP